MTGELETEEFVEMVLAKMDPEREMEETWEFLDKDQDGEMIQYNTFSQHIDHITTHHAA